MASPKSVKPADDRASNRLQKSAHAGKRCRFSATTSLPICQAFWPDSAPFLPAPRLQHLVREIHALGERPLFELFRELERGADLHGALERHARLAPFAAFTAENGGRNLPKTRAVG